MIFVQIAAYRDPELLPTIRDCLAKADFPDDLRFGICWQTDAADRTLEPFLGSDRFRIKRVPWHESKGLCWARAEIQKLYGGEEFTLQLDSHHRFEQGWDRFLRGCKLCSVKVLSLDRALLSGGGGVRRA